MTLWKIVSGLGSIVGGIAMVIIIIAVCIWAVAGVIGWLLDHSFAEVFGGEDWEEDEVPLREKIPAPPPIPRANPAAQVKTPLAADFRIFADKIATSYGSEIWPRDVWVVDTGHSKVAWSSLQGAIDSIPDGKTFIVFDITGKTIQYGTKNDPMPYPIRR